MSTWFVLADDSVLKWQSEARPNDVRMRSIITCLWRITFKIILFCQSDFILKILIFIEKYQIIFNHTFNVIFKSKHYLIEYIDRYFYNLILILIIKQDGSFHSCKLLFSCDRKYSFTKESAIYFQRDSISIQIRKSFAKKCKWWCVGIIRSFIFLGIIGDKFESNGPTCSNSS